MLITLRRRSNRLYFLPETRNSTATNMSTSYFDIALIIRSVLIIISCLCYLCDADLTSESTSSSISNFLKVPNFCNDCSRSGCLHQGKCRSDDGRCECERGFWGNRCQYKMHEMYKFGQCPTEEVIGNSVFDWPQLQPDGCHVDADCPGLWKCCPSFVATGDQGDIISAVGTRSCTQPWLEAPLISQLPLCLQHLWNVTDAGRTYSGCDILMCDESSGGRTFDRWQCNYCDATSTTCFCFISFDNEGKYWGELPGSRQKLNTIGDETTQRPGVIHRKPKHDCSLQDRCPQMFPHSIYCTHGIQRDTSGCPTGDCLSTPEDKCFTSCSAGFLCEHRPEPEQVNHWHCIDTFRPFRVALHISSRIAFAIGNDLANVSAKAAELIALNAVVDESIISLLSNYSTLNCKENSAESATLRATTAASAFVLPFQDDPTIAVIEIVGQVAFSANFSGITVRRQLKEWLNETYGSRLVSVARASRGVSTLSVAAIAVIISMCLLLFLTLVISIPLIVYRRRLFTSNKFSFTTSNNQQTHFGGVFSAFTNPNHRYGGGVVAGSFATSSPSSSSSSENGSQAHQMNSVKTTKSRPAPLPPTTVTPLPEISSTSSSEDDGGSVSPNNMSGTSPGIGQPIKPNEAINEGYQAF